MVRTVLTRDEPNLYVYITLKTLFITLKTKVERVITLKTPVKEDMELVKATFINAIQLDDSSNAETAPTRMFP